MRRLGLIAAALALAACGTLFRSHTPPPSIYLLSATGAATSAEIPIDLAVLKPRVRVGLDNDLIAVLYPDRRLDYFAGARWSGPLDEVLHDLALQVLRARVNMRNVHADASVFGSGYWLEIDVVDFQAEYTASAVSGGGAPTVHVRLLGRVGGSGDRRIIGLFVADTRQPAAENRLGAIVEAYNQAANTALARIAADAAETLSRNLEHR